MNRFSALLFDLDGTLADTAPDLAGAANALRIRRGLAPLPLEILRPWASHGARGLLGAAFELTPDDATFADMREEFLDYYAAHLAIQTCVFPAMAQLLDTLDARRVPWGIVTNKHTRFTTPLVAALGLAARARVVVSGDTTAHSKPHPAPLLHAAAALALDPQHCLYIGDDLRDVQAGRAAAMPTAAAAWGYCSDGPPDQWGADYLVHTPQELLPLL
ncbi:MAG: phosphoglycolate phosphatase [Burkholderiaceae bacterium]|nr:MAG: phosphoglycolate phosphatase [Burkholderiaceae bacterium]